MNIFSKHIFIALHFFIGKIINEAIGKKKPTII